MVFRNNAAQLRGELVPVLEFFDNPMTGSFSTDFTILLSKLGEFAKNFGDTKFMTTYHQLSFKYYDKDGNGTIDRDEFKKIMDDMDKLTNTKMDGKTSDDVFNEYDQNGDGVIDFNEFLELVQTNDAVTSQRKKVVWRNSADFSQQEQESSDFVSSLDSVLEFLGVQKSDSIISDLANIETFVKKFDAKELNQEIRAKMFDTLFHFYATNGVATDAQFALIAIDFADVTGIEDIAGYTNEALSRAKIIDHDLSLDEAKKIILDVASL